MYNNDLTYLPGCCTVQPAVYTTDDMSVIGVETSELDMEEKALSWVLTGIVIIELLRRNKIIKF